MNSLNRLLAEAVAEALNVHAFSQPFEAVSQFVPGHDLEELEQLTVTVVPARRKVTISSRAGTFFDLSVMVGLQQQCRPTDDERIDSLLDLGNEILLYLRQTPLATFTDAHFLEAGEDDIFDPDHLVVRHVFSGVLTLTYRVQR